MKKEQEYRNRIIQLIPADGWTAVVAWRDSESNEIKMDFHPVVAWALVEHNYQLNDWEIDREVHSLVIMPHYDGMPHPILMEEMLCADDAHLGHYRTEKINNMEDTSFWQNLVETAKREIELKERPSVQSQKSAPAS